MPQCQRCQNTWTWKETIKKSFVFKYYVICPYCKEKQVRTNSSKQNMSMAVVSPSWLLPLFILFDLPLPLLLLSYFAAFALSPFLMKLSNEDAPLW
ncbi:TIGR04104 family putative zinc finger protein [Jeotgalibacillus proteolyticus]|uniref:Cxxc_20_cxxc protein n=1 Tax=Jeotgalibacillus proteolyticus TaxID=2082395 RepID=A0A2S5GD17_9BACL|nr:hypothetical protein C4B60_08460 [Jeotgalibacillus proteolyticus]